MYPHAQYTLDLTTRLNSEQHTIFSNTQMRKLRHQEFAFPSVLKCWPANSFSSKYVKPYIYIYTGIYRCIYAHECMNTCIYLFIYWVLCWLSDIQFHAYFISAFFCSLPLGLTHRAIDFPTGGNYIKAGLSVGFTIKSAISVFILGVGKPQKEIFLFLLKKSQSQHSGTHSTIF